MFTTIKAKLLLLSALGLLAGNAAREHNGASADISQASERITAMVDRIKEVCGEQSRCAARHADEMEEIARSADGNLQASAGLNDAVTGLGAEVAVLQRERSGFITA
jgi:methyl-accepting chemotaxis protein